MSASNYLHPKTARELAQYVMKKYPIVTPGSTGWAEMMKLQELVCLAERAAGKAVLDAYAADNP